MEKRDSIKRSMLWAAYGDALGFISELASEHDVHRRVGSSRVTSTIPWMRRIGGRSGADIELPAGCYSDDTQLRLATCRAIRHDGSFDVEVFAKIELPVWLSYALGAGRGTRAAAEALTKRDTIWATNFFNSKTARYVECGGNGAAMRIQPHVWSAPDGCTAKDMLRDVIRNAITTHGHPRGIVGAAFHAMSLRSAMRVGTPPGPEDWLQIAEELNQLPSIISEDKDLSLLWMPTWAHEVGVEFEVACKAVLAELVTHIRLASVADAADAGADASGKAQVYARLARDLGCLSPASRGEGTRTAVLASFVAWFFRADPGRGLLETVNLLGSDTDTIASMAGAILGATMEVDVPGVVADAEYMTMESRRLFELSRKSVVENFLYPDLLVWEPPQAGLDANVDAEGCLEVAGLGRASILSREYAPYRSSPYIWQWVGLAFGQQMLIKRRQEQAARTDGRASPNPEPRTQVAQGVLFGSEQNTPADSGPISPRSLEDATNIVVRSDFDPKVIGNLLIEFAHRTEDGIELSIGFAAIVAKAKQARLRRAGVRGVEPVATKPAESESPWRRTSHR